MAPREYQPLSGTEAYRDEEEGEGHAPRIEESQVARPPVYYGEGPFDAPSSESEDETLLEKGPDSPTAAEHGLDGDMATGSGLKPYAHKPRPNSLKLLVISLCSLLIMAIVIGIMAARTYTGTSYRGMFGKKHITMDHVFNGTFSSYSTSIRWIPEAGDGVFSTINNGVVQLVDLKTNTTRNLVKLKDVNDENGKPLWIDDWKVSPDMEDLLIKTDHKKQWRHSSFGNYYVHNIATKKTFPIAPVTQPPTVSYATWSPTGEAIAFVMSNDLYILPSISENKQPIRITTSGNSSLFHGVPDWVYEEEIFSSDYALWWSPDSSRVAFLRLDETLVDEFKFPIYNPSEDSFRVFPYTEEVVMKYPKPGYNNPIVSVHVFDLAKYLHEDPLGLLNGFPIHEATITLDWENKLPETDSVIMEVAWVGNANLIVKEVSRAADVGNVAYFDLETDSSGKGRVVRKLGRLGEQGDEGWIESNQNIRLIPPSLSGGEPAYLDVVNNSDGYNHLALFRPAYSSEPIFVTSGNWEVTSGVHAISDAGEVYFTAAYPSSIERNVFSAQIPTISTEKKVAPDAPTALTNENQPSYYKADFSPFAGFYLLSYQGPNVPWQKVMKVGDKDFSLPVTDNARLNQTTTEFEAPVILYSTIESDGYELNVRELRPPGFDETGKTKYPVLFQVYGGPGAQLVDIKFQRDWHHYLACSLKYVVVTVDGRGTGFKGRNLRNPVRGNLGFFETKDQVEAARIYAAKPYVDRKKIGIWGWSYGGFMAAKVAEADAGIHTLAMSIAPVTSWRLYDSIYTERYLSLPSLNPGGYTNASIASVTAFDKIDYLFAHGSGDDNVHYANSARLLDMLTRGKVRGFRFRMFTDSDHGISRRGAYREVYEFMTGFLMEKWGKGGTRRAW